MYVSVVGRRVGFFVFRSFRVACLTICCVLSCVQSTDWFSPQSREFFGSTVVYPLLPSRQPIFSCIHNLPHPLGRLGLPKSEAGLFWPVRQSFRRGWRARDVKVLVRTKREFEPRLLSF